MVRDAAGVVDYKVLGGGVLLPIPVKSRTGVGGR